MYSDLTFLKVWVSFELRKVKLTLKNHRVGHELRFINENEKASVTDFFIPAHRELLLFSVSSAPSVVF